MCTTVAGLQVSNICKAPRSAIQRCMQDLTANARTQSKICQVFTYTHFSFHSQRGHKPNSNQAALHQRNVIARLDLELHCLLQSNLNRPSTTKKREVCCHGVGYHQCDGKDNHPGTCDIIAHHVAAAKASYLHTCGIHAISPWPAARLIFHESSAMADDAICNGECIDDHVSFPYRGNTHCPGESGTLQYLLFQLLSSRQSCRPQMSHSLLPCRRACHSQFL